MVPALRAPRRLAAFLMSTALACSTARAPAPVAPPAPVAAVAPAPSADQAFEAFARQFLDAYLRRAPDEATLAGEHRYDATWPDVSAAGEAADRAFLADTRAALAAMPREALSVQNRIDAAILDDRVRYGLFVIDELKPRERNPLTYVGLIGDGLDPLVTRSFGTRAQRLTSLAGRLEGVPAIVAVAKQRLAHATKVHTETAIQQVKGLIELVEIELPAQFAAEPALRDRLAAAARTAGAALHELEAFLARDLLPRADGSFRLGRARFTTALGFALGEDVDIDAFAASARALLTATQAEMVATATQIWTDDKLGPLPALKTAAQQKAFVRRVLDHVATDRPTNTTILADAKAWLDQATAFVRAHDLVRVPDEPVAIIEMPEYKRGVAVAYCDSSGPLEATPETFYAIAPTPTDWPAARVASFYREWLMAEKGFGGPRVKLQRQKMILRLAANAILDHGVHAGQLDEAAALALMKDEAFQEDGEAVGKWKRAQLSSAQLSTYFYGFTELLKLRRIAEAQPGFTERAYHDRLLSWGSPAMKYVRQLLATPD